MLNYPVDVTIYIENLKLELTEDNCKELCEDLEVTNWELFREALLYEFTLNSIDNFHRFESPVLTPSQITECMYRAATQYHVDRLVDCGVLNAQFTDAGIGYSLTEAGKEFAKSCIY
jgi:hypothetical protein